ILNKGVFVKERAPQKDQKQQDRGRTSVPGQNPKQDDSVHKDEYHDETRKNQFDPEVAEALKPDKKQKPEG
ncbi:MAG: hypothetical protein ACK4UN_19660, partial [Limisphaerales bacterium]